jgi:uracil-DNA glycosylase family 4
MPRCTSASVARARGFAPSASLLASRDVLRETPISENQTEVASQSALDELHETVDACRKCEASIPNLCKPVRMFRGTPGKVIIVGQGPGRKERAIGYAFAGQSGKRLDEWLRKCRTHGLARDGIYLTSVVKCVKKSARELEIMAKNCRPFLEAQISLIRPKLIITLGQLAFETLNFSEMTFSNALCTPLESRQHVLLPPFGYHLTLLPWPHPSGLNRWLNEKENRQKLERSFRTVATFLS